MKENTNFLSGGKVGWRSPSNIAIVKYWGKKEGQIPMNPSISLTLSKAFTETSIEFRNSYELKVEFYFEGEEKEAFKSKIEKYISKLSETYPGLARYSYKIESANSFPHSAGIASSASSMSALAMCLSSIIYGGEMDGQNLMSASEMARLGSGSACRSLFPVASCWGESIDISGSSDRFGIGLQNEISQEFASAHDTILLVDCGEKSVSSTQGHALMKGHPFEQGRIVQAQSNLKRLYTAMQAGNWEDFIEISELEALSLHGLMMSSTPSFILMHPNTLNIIERLRSFRNESKLPITFTLDAGPNVHILYPDRYKEPIQEFISAELIPFCEDGKVLYDQVGNGPERLIWEV